MADVPMQVILAAFKDEEGAEVALGQLNEAQQGHLIKIENVAVPRCNQQPAGLPSWRTSCAKPVRRTPLNSSRRI
jgi:hypothetical protein